MIGYVKETSNGVICSTSALVKENNYIQRLTIKNTDILDFSGFDDEYSQLHISYQRGKANSDRYGKYIEIYQDGDLKNLKHPVILKPNSGSFSIQNIGSDTGYIELVLTKDMYRDYE